MKAKTTVKMLGLGLALALLAAPVMAAPSLLGPTGLLITPTAESLGRADFDLGAFLVSGDTDETIITGNVGLGSGVEVGLTNLDARHGSSETILNGKYVFARETATRPAIAVGLIDATDRLDSTPYVVASKSILPTPKSLLSLRVHGGIGGGTLDGLFAGVELGLASRITLMAEYDSEDINVGARFGVGVPGLQLHAGWLSGPGDFVVGASFSRPF